MIWGGISLTARTDLITLEIEGMNVHRFIVDIFEKRAKFFASAR